MCLAKLGKGMLSSVEQVFVGRDERQAPLKAPAWEASTSLNIFQTFFSQLQKLHLDNCVEDLLSFTCNLVYYKGDNFSDSSFHHIFESENFSFPFFYKR